MTDEILKITNTSKAFYKTQKIQTEHRLKLIEFWEIKPGSRVLEIGCGQGDTLTALAFVCGEKGFVHGVDIASEDYGSPETLGQARDRIKNSPIGGRVKIDFGFDIMDEHVSFAEDEFDCVIMSHCLWYLSDYKSLSEILKRVKPWGKQLCIAEWNPCIEIPEQIPHMNAATIQAVCSSFEQDCDSNIRTMFYPSDIKSAVIKSGWIITKTSNIYSPDIQDGKWEIELTECDYPAKINNLSNMPYKLKRLLLSQIDELKQSVSVKPMSAFCLVCKK